MPILDTHRIKTTFWRIAIFYVGGCAFLLKYLADCPGLMSRGFSVFVAGLLVPATSPELLNSSKTKASAAASPFVVAVQMAGIKVLPSSRPDFSWPATLF